MNKPASTKATARPGDAVKRGRTLTPLKRPTEALLQLVAYLRRSSNDTVLELRPRVQLDGYSCGLQCLAAILDYYEVSFALDDLSDELKLTADGSDDHQVRATLRANGLSHRSHSRMSLNKLRACIDHGYPVLVAMDEDSHWAVVYGYGEHAIYVMDPSILRALKHGGKWPVEVFTDSWNRHGIEVYEDGRKARARKKQLKPNSRKKSK